MCDEALLELANEATRELDAELTLVTISTERHEGWERLSDLRRGHAIPAAHPGRR